MVAAGTTTGSFTASAAVVSSTQNATITATLGSSSASTQLTLEPVGQVSFVQSTAKVVNAKSLSVSLKTTTAGDLILLGLGYHSKANITSITDSQGNTFVQVGTQLVSPGGGQNQVFYANNIRGGAEKITITISASSQYFEAYVTEYSGVDPIHPINAQSGAVGSAGTVSSGSATTSVAGAMISGYCMGDSSCTVGSGFAARSTLDANLTEDKVAGSPGSYAATATADGGWTMQMIALAPAAATSSLTAGPSTSSAAGSSASSKLAAKAVAGTADASTAGAISAMSCSPGSVSPGGSAICELHVAAASVPPSIQLTSSTPAVRVPDAVTARPNQSSLTFQATVDSTAKQESAVIIASLGAIQAQASILVSPGGPVLSAPGKQIVKVGTPADFIVKATDPGDLPLQITAQGLPSGAVFDPLAGKFHWTPDTVQADTYQVTFTAMNSARQSTSAVVSIAVGSGVPLLDGQKLSCSPGAIAGLSGEWLAADGSVLADPTGGSDMLGGTKVEVNGASVAVLFRSATTVKFLCPDLAPGTTLAVQVDTDAGSTGVLSGTMLEATPDLATLDGSGQGQAVAYIGGTGNLAMNRNFRTSAQPAQPGDEILITATGLGQIASGGRVEVSISGIDAAADSVIPLQGEAGLYTIQARVPTAAALGNAVPLQIQVITPDGRQFLSKSATVTIEQVRR